MATAISMVLPALPRIGEWASQAPMAIAPSAGAERNRPSPQGPTCRMSCATMGSSAVAPPKSTATRSSEMAPRMTSLERMKRRPALRVSQVMGPRPPCGRVETDSRVTQRLAAAKKRQATRKGATGPST